MVTPVSSAVDWNSAKATASVHVFQGQGGSPCNIYNSAQHGARLHPASNPMISGSPPPGACPHFPYHPSIVPRINVLIEPQNLALGSTSLRRPVTTAIRGPNVPSLYQSYSAERMEILCFFLPRMGAGVEPRSSRLASVSRNVVRDSG